MCCRPHETSLDRSLRDHHLNGPFTAKHVHADVVTVPDKVEVNERSAHPQVGDADLVQEGRQPGTIEPDPWFNRAQFQSQTCLEE